eukprot:421422-Pyramimonas_sp.AAC.1
MEQLYELMLPLDTVGGHPAGVGDGDPRPGRVPPPRLRICSIPHPGWGPPRQGGGPPQACGQERRRGGVDSGAQEKHL